jgi:hypothetical protein
MKPIGMAVAAAVLLWWVAAGKAAEPITLSPLPADKAFPIQSAAPACGCASCSPCTSSARCGCCALGAGRLRAWLSYRPLHRVQCGECRSCCGGRWVPLYEYFLGSCKEHPCTSCGSAGCSGCAGGRPLSGSATGWGIGMSGE